jgi:hypothetical protein
LALVLAAGFFAAGAFFVVVGWLKKGKKNQWVVIQQVKKE